MSKRYMFYFISGALIIASVIGMFVVGFNYGIDFKGGNSIHLTFDEVANEAKIRSAFDQIAKSYKQSHAGKDLYFKQESIHVQPVVGGGDKEFIITYPADSQDTAESAKTHDFVRLELKKILPYAPETLEVANVGPTLGEEMKNQGMVAAILSCIGILLYLGWRFDFQSALGVVIAVVHDLLIVLGFICFTSMEFDTTVLAAVLTLLGYSVNDSIVVLDRIRENKRISKNDVPFGKIVDNSICQSLSRTINTTITTLLALIALVLYGGPSIHSFSIALTVGAIVGTYSSNCLVGPVVADLFEAQVNKGTASNR